MWVLLVWACSGAGEREPQERWPIQGMVLEVREDTVVLDHEPIPGFMDAMIMELEADPEDLHDLSPGRRIEAVLLVSGDRSRLAEVHILGTERRVAPVVEVTPPLRPGELLQTLTIPLAGGGSATLGVGQAQPTVLAFLFTTCPLPEYCPLLATKLVALQGRIRGRGQILAITLDPATDTLDVLERYGERIGADPAVWRFGRLEEDAMQALLDQAGVVRFEGEVGIRHALRLLVLDAEGRLIRVEADNRWSIENIALALLSG